MKISVFAEHLFEAADQEKITFEKALDEAAQSDINGVELDFARLEKDDALPCTIRKHGLDIACVYVFLDFSHSEDMSYAVKVVDTLKRHDVKRLMAIPGFVYDGDDAAICTARMYKCIGRMFAKTHLRTQRISVSRTKQFVFDDKTAVFSTTEGLIGFMENVTGLGCAFDTGNFIYSCENALDAFEKLKEDYGDKVVIVAVNCGEKAETVKEFVDENGYTFAFAIDEKAEISTNIYPTMSIPYTVLIDANGNLAEEFVGAVSAEKQYKIYKEAIEKVLNEKE